MMKFAYYAGILSLFALVKPASAFEMAAPLQCDLATDCYIQQYIDHDTGPGARDTRCGPRSYDGHKGTDFAVVDMETMRRGVPVAAVADGVVTGVRDGMADGAFVAGQSVTGRECGNGVSIRHADGWTSQYCHMQQGSVVARKGETVTSGAQLGTIGMSGQAEFPHLHLQVKRGDSFIDPFDATAMQESCDQENASLWAKDSGVEYSAGGLIGVGIIASPPEYDAIKATSPHFGELPRNAPAMVLWVHAFSLEKGDVLALSLTGPDGETIAESSDRITKHRAREMRFSGRKRRGDAWPSGTYSGRVLVRRAGELIVSDEITTTIR